MRLQRELPSLQSWIKTLTLLITEKSSVRHRIEEGGSGVSVSWISSNKEERSLILLIMVETFLVCTKGNFSIEPTSLHTWIRESSKVPDGNKPGETIIADRTLFILVLTLVGGCFCSFLWFAKFALYKELDYSESFYKAISYIKIIVKEVICLIKCMVLLSLSICAVSAKDKNKSIEESWVFLGVLPFGGFSWLARLVGIPQLVFYSNLNTFSHFFIQARIFFLLMSLVKHSFQLLGISHLWKSLSLADEIFKWIFFSATCYLIYIESNSIPNQIHNIHFLDLSFQEN